MSGPAAGYCRHMRVEPRGYSRLGARCGFGSYSSRCERLCTDVPLPRHAANSRRAPSGRGGSVRRMIAPARRSNREGAAMLDLGTSFLASVARDPEALAIVDGDVRLTYGAWYEKISALVAGFDGLGLRRGDHLVTVLQNRWEAATIHWACQFAGIIITPLNWRSTAEDLDFCLDDAEAKAILYEEVSAAAVRSSKQAHARPRIALGNTRSQDLSFDSLTGAGAGGVRPRVDAEAWSVMLYTSGTTARPKGVPRRQRAERAAALAHVAQNLYAAHERTLGAMPLYHTMGVRSLLAMSLIGGAFVSLLQGDESFEGYWRRPDSDAKALRGGWYFTGDTGYVDGDGDLFVTGRVDDMIISGGGNISPVEIESCLSLHPAVSEVAVVGIADERWGKVVSAFVKRRGVVEPEELDQFCRTSGLATFKRPRRYVFVKAIPKSPVGKLLRRKLVAGEYEPERAVAFSGESLSRT